mmetsp:Transcript_19658/g.39557  ORF Transcript_19658/g.39557 Transcript_19658/m.39557 type:complete len:459 (+) Transcript_19658:71-1447(+)
MVDPEAETLSPNPSGDSSLIGNIPILKSAVHAAITNFLHNRLSSHGDIAADVYRTLRDEAGLLFERQLIFDALDSDPFELTKIAPSEHAEKAGDDDEADDEVLLDKKRNAQVIARVKDMLTVISCTRTTTQDGYSSIQATVQLKNDGQMSVDHVKLYFSFLREPQRPSADESRPSDNGSDDIIYADRQDTGFSKEDELKTEDGKPQHKKCKRKFKEDEVTSEEHQMKKSKQNNVRNSPANYVESQTSDNEQILSPKTIVIYNIDLSVDNGKVEPLLAVQVLALGNHPSVEPAVPMDEGDVDGDDDEGADAENDAQCNVSCIDGGSNRSKEKNGSGKLTGYSQNIGKEKKKNVEESEEIVMSKDDEHSDDGDDIDKADRFGVFIEPVNVVKFLEMTSLNLNDQSVFYFLMTFPFYEHEWDISGFLCSAVFDEDEDEEVDDCCDEGSTECMKGCCASDSH